MNREERRRQNKINKLKPTVSPTAMSGDTLKLFKKAKFLFELSDYEAADELCQEVTAKAPLMLPHFIFLLQFNIVLEYELSWEYDFRGNHVK